MTTCKYPGCEYDESGHRPYARLRDGVPSVTTIAGSLDVGDKARAFAWSACLIAATTAVHQSNRWWNLPTHGKQGLCSHMADEHLCLACRFIRSEFDRVWKTKQALGGHVHHMALQWAMGEEVEVDSTTEPYMDALQRFYDDCDPDFQHLERTVRFDSGNGPRYRGQFDFIARLVAGEPGVERNNTERRLGLWDIKTGGFYPVEQTLQLSAYRYAHWLTEWDGKKEERICPMPEVDEAGVLLLHDDGTYDLIALPADRWAFHRFQEMLAVWRWAKDIEKWDKERKRELNEDRETGDADAGGAPE